MNKKISVIYGDGIGAEITQQALKVLDAVTEIYGHEFEYKYALLGADAIEATGMPLPPETIESALNSDAILFGTIGNHSYGGDADNFIRPDQGILAIRKALQLYANVRPVTIYPNLVHLSPLKPQFVEHVDLVILRELSGGIYFGEKELNLDGTLATDTSAYSTHEIERIAHKAFKMAMTRRKKLTLVDKANVLETSKLWRKTVQKIEKEYPSVITNYMFVDTAAMQLILNPAQFDVILTENMFGDILSDEASVITGSPGLSPSASFGNHIGFFAPIIGAQPLAAGKDIANPIGAILSAAMMLDYFGMIEEALLVRTAINWTLASGFVSKDIDPINHYYTSTIGDLVSDFVYGKVPESVNKQNIEIMKSTII